MPKLDLEAIRQAVVGKGVDVLVSLGGVDRDILDTKHHPCPKCGGNDRFRAFNDVAEKGGLLCNQCGTYSDVFASLQWLLGCTFVEAAEKVGDLLNVQKVGDSDPAKDLEWVEWSSGLMPYFTQKRPGVTEAALKVNGARMARYKKKFTVFALPIIGESLDLSKPVGWAIMNAMGGTLPKWNKSGENIGDVKIKITYGSKPGLIGTHAIERLPVDGLAEVIWKVEGVSDMLALWAAIPNGEKDKHLVVTNANGAGEKPKWMASAIARARPMILHDADEPGEAGAKLWANEIARQGVRATVVRLPYEVAETHGKDVRDWLNDANDYVGLKSLADKGEPVLPKKAGDVSPGSDASDFPIQELILKKLELEVLYELADGQLRVFSSLLRKSSTIFPEKLSKARLISAAGPTAMHHVSEDPDNVNTWSMSDVREALAIQGAFRRTRHNERGVGIWAGEGHRHATIIANNTSAAIWNGDEVLRRVEHPKVGGLMLDFGAEDGEDWFDFEKLADYTAKARDSVEWREDAITRAVDLFGRWNWGGENDAELVAGLVMASWLQTTWSWRPMIFITGESNSGKSTLFQALGGTDVVNGIFGNLKFKGKATEAGLRQSIRNTGRIVLLDEFESSRDREAIIQVLRSASRGDEIVKGSATQKKHAFTFRHIAWCAAIESGLKAQPDLNRFIRLNLLPARRGMENNLTLPAPAELSELGLRLLATAIVGAGQAHQIAERLRQHRIEGGNPRQIETYAVPAACLAAGLGVDQAAAERLLEGLMQSGLADFASESQSDHDEALEAILSSPVRCGSDGDRTVAQILGGRSSSLGMHLQTLEANGVIYLEDDKSLAVNRANVCRTLLRGTEWEKKNLTEVLKRIEGADCRQIKRNGRPLRYVVIPWAPD